MGEEGKRGEGEKELDKRRHFQSFFNPGQQRFVFELEGWIENVKTVRLAKKNLQLIHKDKSSLPAAIRASHYRNAR
jgi:hypothetical protein